VLTLVKPETSKGLIGRCAVQGIATLLMNLYVRSRDAISSLSYVSVALIGAAIGGLVILLGGHFHVGSWFVSGTQAYIPSMIAGAIIALLIRYLLRRP
jgi:hypothetical protein